MFAYVRKNNNVFFQSLKDNLTAQSPKCNTDNSVCCWPVVFFWSFRIVSVFRFGRFACSVRGLVSLVSVVSLVLVVSFRCFRCFSTCQFGAWNTLTAMLDAHLHINKPSVIVETSVRN